QPAAAGDDRLEDRALPARQAGVLQAPVRFRRALPLPGGARAHELLRLPLRPGPAGSARAPDHQPDLLTLAYLRPRVPAGRDPGHDQCMTPRVPFFFVDVFASRPLTGNPLSLVPDADGLAEAQMQAIARELNQSETTFVLSASKP